MTAIGPKHIEWATVDRMRQMLARPRPGFEVTETLALFTGILCWTMQRIRSRPDGTVVASQMALLCESLGHQPFWRFMKTDPQAVLTTDADKNGRRTEVALNSVAEFADENGPLDALQSLVLLRNAVGHGDARLVTPINRDGLLIGFRFACSDKSKKWRGNINLDTAGMASIAGELADQFCAALQKGDDLFTVEASQVREVQQ